MEETLQEQTLTSLLLQKEKELQNLAKQRIGQLQDQLAVKDEHISNLESQIRRLHEDFEYNLKLVQDRDEEIAELESTVNEMAENIKEKEQEVAECKANAATYRNREDSSFEMTIRQKEEELQKAYETIQELNQNCQSSHLSYITKLEADLKDYKSQIKELNSQIDKQKTKTKEQEQITHKNKASYQEEINRAYELVRKKDLYIEELEQLNYDQKEKEENELSHKVYVLEREKHSLKQEIENLRSAHQDEVNYLESLKANSQETLVKNHKSQIARLESQIKDLLSENKEAQSQVDSLQSQNLKLQTQNSIQNQNLRKQVTELTSKVEHLESSLGISEKEKETLRQQLDHWRELAHKRSEEVAESKHTQLHAEESYKSLQKEIEVLKRTYEREKELSKEETAREVQSQMENKLRNLQLEINRLKRDTPKPEPPQPQKEAKEYQEIMMEMERARDTVYTQEREIRRLQSLVANLREEKEQAVKEKEMLKESNLRLMAEKDPYLTRFDSLENCISMLNTEIKDFKSKTPPLSQTFQEKTNSRHATPKRRSKIQDLKTQLDKTFGGVCKRFS